ncbi:hypothetical protein ACFPM0_11100 [Pseudonocardia sulfidoxydans]|uniref:hypothetical protein n=1 Tax=Pseudonocardia sulfidoxydans TaxID=54011 RepID=UPI00361D9929
MNRRCAVRPDPGVRAGTDPHPHLPRGRPDPALRGRPRRRARPGGGSSPITETPTDPG